MASLKLKVQSLDELDESIREAAKALYVERDGEWHLPEIEGLPDVAGINNALRLERKRAKELADQVKRFDGVDPEKYRTLLDREAEFERGDEANKGKISEVLTRYQREHQTQMDELRGQLKTLQDERDAAKLAQKRLRIERDFDEAARKLKVRAAYMDDVRLRAQQADVLDDGTVAMLGADGEPLVSSRTGKAMTPDEWLTGMQEAKPDWFEASTGGGAAGSGPRRNGPGVIDRSDREQFMANLEKIARGEIQVRG